MEQKETCTSAQECPHCKERKRKEAIQEEMQLSILLAMVPLMVITLFGQMGLF